MKGNKQLAEETVVFTGTLKSQDVFELVKEYGGSPVSLPLIRVAELEEKTDKLRLEACASYDWLIFTSQSAVASFRAKLERYNILVESIPANIAAIGTRTAAALEQIGFTVQFIPTAFSADVFVKQFKPTENDARRLLFLRGSIAGPTISEELPFVVDEWTVYDTVTADENAGALVELIQKEPKVSVLFASPSAVNVFAEQVAPHTGWDRFIIGAIGHVTERALLKVGASVHVRPDTYTLKHLVEKLAERKDEYRG